MADEILNLTRDAPPDEALWGRILGQTAPTPAAGEPPAAAPSKASILGAGAETFKGGLAKLGRGGKRIVSGVEEGSGEIALFEMVSGLIQSTLGVPVAMAGTAAEKFLPEFVRSRQLDVPLTPEQRQRLAGGFHVALGLLGADITTSQQMEETFKGSQPLTYGDAVNFATQLLAIPAGLKSVKATKGALAEHATAATVVGTGEEVLPARPSVAQLAGRQEVSPLGAPEVEAPLRVNLDRIAAPETIKSLIEDINHHAAGRTAELGGAIPKTHGETIARAGELKLTIEQALSDEFLAKQSMADLRPMGLALRELRDATAFIAEDLARKATEGDAAAADRLPLSLAVLSEVEARRTMFSGEIGGALEAHNILSAAGRSTIFKPEALSELGAEIASGAALDGFALAERIQKLPTVAQRQTFMGNLVTAVKAGNKLFHAIWIQNLLTGAKTHAANLLGTTMATLWEVPERTVAGAINRAFFKNPQGVQAQEGLAVIRGLAEGPADGLALAAKAFREKQEPFGRSLVERHLSSTSLELDPQTPLGHLADVIGNVVETYGPGRLLVTEDAFLKGVNARMELKALGVRQALAETLHPGTSAYDTRVASLETRPTPRMWADVKEAATLRTMNAELGAAGKMLMSVRDNVPGLPYVLAFMRTPINLAKWAFQRGPLTSLISPENIQGLLNAAENPAARDRTLAKITLGHTIGAYLAWEVAQGVITGSGPEDRTKKTNMRNAGWQPNAIRVGDEFFTYGRGADPLGIVVGAIADFVEMGSQLPQDSPWWQRWGVEFPLLAAQAIGHQVINKTYMQGLGDLIDAIRQPDEKARKMALGFARSLVPTLVRDVTKVMDPATKHITTLGEAIKAGVPGWSKTVAPNQNHITGEVIYYPPGWGPDLLSPITVTKLTDDPVLRQIVEHDMSLAAPSDYLGGRRVAAVLLREPTPQDGIFIDGWTRKRLIDIATQEIKDGSGRTLHQHLASLVETWERLPADDQPSSVTRESQFKSVYHKYYDLAEAQLLEERSDLKQVLQKKKAERIIEKLPPGRQREAEEAIKDLRITLGR